MGKTKISRGFYQHQCSTRDLHIPEKSYDNAILVHASRIKGPIKEELLQKVGKTANHFKGKICSECIKLVQPKENEEGLATNTQEDSTTNNLCDLSSDSFHIDDSQENGGPFSTGVDAGANTDHVYVLSVVNLKSDVEAMPVEFRSMLAFELGNAERCNVKADTIAITKGRLRDISSLTSLCQEKYLMDRNEVVVNFLAGLYNADRGKRSPSGALPFPIDTPADIYKISKVTEACMGLTTPISVLPFHFRELVLLYSLTRSRMALSLLSSTSPHGSYATVRNWLEKLSNQGLGKLPADEGDVLAVFDNNQVMQRRWQISVNNTATCSVITMIMFIEINSKGTLEFKESLKPSEWMWSNLSQEKIDAIKMGHRNSVHRSIKYEKHFHPWLTDIIHQVALEQTSDQGVHVDPVDAHVKERAHAKDFKTCPSCGNLNVPKRARICRTCNQKVSSMRPKTTQPEKSDEPKSKKSKDGEFRVHIEQRNSTAIGLTYEKTTKQRTPYDHLQENHPLQPPEVIIGEPLFVNPCSYESVANVFRAIGKQAGIRQYGGKREWLAVVCDGLPYVMGYRLIENMCQCCLCGETVYGQAECRVHMQTHEGSDCTFSKEFDWVLLQPGPGHVEMNMLKSFVKFSWFPFWEEMVEVFNFRSENAKRSALKVSDHHKGMTLARIARESFAKELVLPYVRQELEKELPNLSVASYLKYAMQNVKSANYAFISDLVFETLDSVFCYRAGVRSGQVALMDAGRSIFSLMWSARSHPLYRQLDTYDSIMSACMPPIVQEFVNKTKSFNLSGVPYSGEGADFKLEEVNRGIQHWIPSVPLDKDWKNACSNYTPLSKLRQSSLDEMKMKDPKERSSKPPTDIAEQVLAFRSVIREKEYILNPGETDSLTSLNKEPLDEDLVNYTTLAQEKKTVFVDNFVEYIRYGNSSKSSVPFNEPPVFVTKEERTAYNDISNKTINECVLLIKKKISEIEDSDMRQNFTVAFEEEVMSKRGKKAVKKDYLDFHELLEEYESYLCSDQHSDNSDDL